jgi:hypothetical protein
MRSELSAAVVLMPLRRSSYMGKLGLDTAAETPPSRAPEGQSATEMRALALQRLVAYLL